MPIAAQQITERFPTAFEKSSACFQHFSENICKWDKSSGKSQEPSQAEDNLHLQSACRKGI